MKMIMNQNGTAVHMAKDIKVIDVARFSIEGKGEKYSIGADDYSLGLYEKEDAAKNAFSEIINFLCDKKSRIFRMPEDE